MLALVLYVMSIGPAMLLIRHGYLREETLEPLYHPLWFLPDGLTRMIAAYANLWAPFPP